MDMDEGTIRIQSYRRKKRRRIEAFHKKLLALHKERERLWKQIRNLGYEPLIPPVQKGWKRIFVLREDVKRSSRADFFEEILRKIKTVQYSHTKEFKVKKRKRGRKIYVPKEQKLRSFYEYEWERIKFTDEQKVYFTEVTLINEKRFLHKMYVFNEPWRFKLKVIPNMITEVKIKDFILEQRINKIDQYFDHTNLTPVLYKLLDGKYHYRSDVDSKVKNPLQNKPLHKILQESYEDHVDEF